MTIVSLSHIEIIIIIHHRMSRCCVCAVLKVATKIPKIFARNYKKLPLSYCSSRKYADTTPTKLCLSLSVWHCKSFCIWRNAHRKTRVKTFVDIRAQQQHTTQLCVHKIIRRRYSSECWNICGMNAFGYLALSQFAWARWKSRRTVEKMPKLIKTLI